MAATQLTRSHLIKPGCPLQIITLDFLRSKIIHSHVSAKQGGQPGWKGWTSPGKATQRGPGLAGWCGRDNDTSARTTKVMTVAACATLCNGCHVMTYDLCVYVTSHHACTLPYYDPYIYSLFDSTLIYRKNCPTGNPYMPRCFEK